MPKELALYHRDIQNDQTRDAFYSSYEIYSVKSDCGLLLNNLVNKIYAYEDSMKLYENLYARLKVKRRWQTGLRVRKGPYLEKIELSTITPA